MSDFEVGDRVRCVNANKGDYFDVFLEQGKIYTVSGLDNCGDPILEELDEDQLGPNSNRFEKVQQTKPQFVEVNFRVPQDLYELLQAIAFEHGLETETLINYCLTDSILHNEENDY